MQIESNNLHLQAEEESLKTMARLAQDFQAAFNGHWQVSEETRKLINPNTTLPNSKR